MPKGVEHLVQKLRQSELKRVESLMPKGVEHESPKLSKETEKLCRISDAERR